MQYTNEIENIGGGGFGGGSNMGSWGMIIFLFLLFIIFSGGGLFGNRHGHDDYVGKCGPTNCEVDRDVIDAKYQNELLTLSQTEKIISNQNGIYEKQQTQALNDSKMENYFLKGQLADVAQNAPILNKLNWLEAHVAEKPPAYATTYVPTGCSIPCNNGRNDRNDYC